MALVVSNSCDNFNGAHPIILAPIRAFPIKEGMSVRDSWRMISEAATGTASPKFFYLPAHNAVGLTRSRAVLPDLFVVDPTYLKRCVDEGGTRRICGLTAEAQRHLQWAIGLMFARNPREDLDWPSTEDLRLKLAMIDDELQQGSRDHEHLKTEREKIARRLEDQGSRTPPAVVAQFQAVASQGATHSETPSTGTGDVPTMEFPEPIVTSESGGESAS